MGRGQERGGEKERGGEERSLKGEYIIALATVALSSRCTCRVRVRVKSG